MNIIQVIYLEPGSSPEALLQLPTSNEARRVAVGGGVCIVQFALRILTVKGFIPLMFYGYFVVIVFLHLLPLILLPLIFILSVVLFFT